MGYRIRHRRADGTTDVTKVANDGSRCTVSRKGGSTLGIVVKDSRGRKKVGYNFHQQFGGKSLSKQQREARIREHLKSLKDDYKHTKGMTRGGTMKHVASIPPEIFWSECAENGVDAIHDRRHMLKLAKQWGFGL